MRGPLVGPRYRERRQPCEAHRRARNLVYWQPLYRHIHNLGIVDSHYRSYCVFFRCGRWRVEVRETYFVVLFDMLMLDCDIIGWLEFVCFDIEKLRVAA